MCDTNKTEVLRLLLVLLSRQIYVPPPSLFTKPSLYSLHLTQKIPRRDVLTLLCSLLNTAMNSSLSSTTSIGSMAGKLPYNHLVFKGEDSRSTLVSTCFQVLCVLLDFQSGSAKDTTGNSGDGQPTAQTNAFRYFLAKLVGRAESYIGEEFTEWFLFAAQDARLCLRYGRDNRHPGIADGIDK
jgi:hypothetical protein